MKKAYRILLIYALAPLVTVLMNTLVYALLAFPLALFAMWFAAILGAVVGYWKLYALSLMALMAADVVKEGLAASYAVCGGVLKSFASTTDEDDGDDKSQG